MTPGSPAARLVDAARRARERLFDPVDPASLVAFRAVLGTLLFASTVRFWAHGWIAEHYLRPRFFFKYYGFEWVRPWPGAWMYVHFAVMAAAAAFIALGLFYRVSAAVFCLLFTYAHFIDKTHYLNHYYFVSLISLLLVFTPLHRAGSLDRRLGLVRGPAVIPRWALWLLRFQVGAVYFFAGVAKLKADWLLHAQPLTIWLGANTDFPVIGPLFRYKATAFAMSWAGAGFDLSVPFLLSFRRTRPFAYAAVIVFHGLTGKLFPIGVFPWIMTASALIFFPEGWPRKLLPARLSARLWPAPPAAEQGSLEQASPGQEGSEQGIPGEAPSPAAPPRPGRLSAGRRLTVAALTGYALIQVLLPLRHLLYPGPVTWTEQGFRFSWKVMLIEKNGDVEIAATDPRTGKRWVVNPRDDLYPYQIKQMSTQPDMILEYCHFVARRFQERGYPDIQVHVLAHVALNGRPPALLIDPDADLGRAPDGLAPYAFLLPAPSTAPQL